MSPLVRIALRYIAAVLIARGFLNEGDGNMLANDPELAAMIEVAVGAAIGAVTELWYTIARRFGWER